MKIKEYTEFKKDEIWQLYTQVGWTAYTENMTTLGCRVKKDQAEKFKTYCAEIGKTSNAVLRDYVLDCIEEKQNAE